MVGLRDRELRIEFLLGKVNRPHKKADYKRAWGSIAKQFVRNPSLVCRDYRAQTVGTAPPHGRSKGPGITYRIFTREGKQASQESRLQTRLGLDRQAICA